MRVHLYINYLNRVGVLCDIAAGAVQVSFVESELDNLWLLSHPMFTIPFIELAKRRGLYSVHAACLSAGGRGVLIPGVSGSGKSTLAVGLLWTGFDFLEDDMAFLSPRPNAVRALGFPDEIDLTENTVRMFPELAFLAKQPVAVGWPKRQLRPEDVYGVEPQTECTPALIVFPTISKEGRSALTPMDRGAALLELAPNVLLTEPSSCQAHLDALARLTRQCECYRLETGQDFEEVATLLRGLLR